MENEESKKGVIPQSEIIGSDADSAYNDEGQFGVESQTESQDKSAEQQKGSDADVNDSETGANP